MALTMALAVATCSVHVHATAQEGAAAIPAASATMYTEGNDLLVQSQAGGDVVINGHSVNAMVSMLRAFFFFFIVYQAQ